MPRRNTGLFCFTCLFSKLNYICSMEEKKYMYLVLKRDYYTFVISIWEKHEDAIKEKDRLFNLARSRKLARDNDWEEENKNKYLVVKREINISQDFEYDFETSELKE